jgi:predicted Zn-dependent peptidase
VQGKYSRDETLTDLVGTYLAGNMISPLFQKLREEKGWVYSVSYMDMMFYDAGVAQFVCRTKADPSVIVSIVRTVLQHIQEIGQRGMDDEKFKEVQEYVTMRIESDKDDVFSWLTMAGEQMMHSDTIDELYPSWIQRVQRVTKQDVNQAASTLFDPKLLYLTIWIPSSYEQTVSTHLSDYLHVDATIQRL